MRILYFISIFLLMCTIPVVNASAIENKVAQTISIVDKTRKTGVNVDDLIDRINEVVSKLDNCGWEECPSKTLDKNTLELNNIQYEAINRRKQPTNWFPILLLIVFILVISNRKFSLSHKIRWLLIKNRKISYNLENEK